MQARLKPSHAIVVWDGGLAADRKELLVEYKAHRPEMPPDLESQLDQIGEFLGASNVFSLMQDGCEADDLIAVVAERAVTAGLPVVIASSDKDFMQLVSDDIRLLNPNDKTDILWGAEEVIAKTGVNPTQIVDWLSLLGDAVDNIPGVAGVGTKTATALLQQFGTLELLYKRIEEVRPDRLRVNLQAAESLVRRNQQLVRLNTQLPCEVRMEDLVCKVADAGALRPLYARWGFKTLLRELEASLVNAHDLFPETAGAC